MFKLCKLQKQTSDRWVLNWKNFISINVGNKRQFGNQFCETLLTKNDPEMANAMINYEYQSCFKRC